MRQINENKNEKKRNAIINKIFEEMKYTEEYIKRWNVSLTEHFSNIYSMDLYYLYQSNHQLVYNLDKKYYSQYNLLDIRKYIQDKSKLDINYGQPLKKITLYDEEGNDYTCEFYQIEWTTTPSNKTKRKFIFENNGNITYSKNKSANLDYIAKYNINSNDLKINFNLEDGPLNIELYDNIQYITLGNLSIETTILNGYKKISYKQQNTKNQTITFEIEIDNFGKIINKYIILKNYNQDNQIDSTYEFYYKLDELIGALYFSKENKKYNMLEDKELTKLAKNILSTINKDNIIFNSSIKELENLVIEIKEQAFRLIKSIKGDIPLYGLEKRLEIALSNINAKAKKIEDNKENLEKTSKNTPNKNKKNTKILKKQPNKKENNKRNRR